MTERSSSSDSAPGLGEQFGRTKNALFGLIRSHIHLARAEFSEIGGEVKRASALAGAALFLLLVATGMLTVGLLLFVGEALFGSIGWGVLDGSELLIGLGILLVLAIIDLDWGRTFVACLIAIVIGLVVSGLLLVDWPWFSARILPASVALAPQLVVAAAVLGAIGALLGFGSGRQGVAGWFVGGAVTGVIVRLALGTFAPLPVMLAVVVGTLLLAAVGAFLGSGSGSGYGFGFGSGWTRFGLGAGALCGALLGLLAGVPTGPRVAAAMGTTVWLLVWPAVAAYFVFRNGVDIKKLRERFVPDVTISTTKETIEWVRQQMPLGPKS
ncbi:MAG TPA: hypothetical protein VF375_06805 [Candidatus Limnocylindrales bacterium]